MSSHINECYGKGRTLEKTFIPEQQQEKILSLAASGLPIQKIEKLVDLSWETIARYCLKDPLFENRWRAARSIGADLLADSLQTAYDNAETVADAMIARGRSDNLRTVAGWRNPQRYGPKLNIDVQHSIDLSKALQQAENRLLPILEQSKLEQPNLTLPPSLDPPAPIQASLVPDRDEQDELRYLARKRAEMDNAISSGKVIDVQSTPTSPILDSLRVSSAHRMDTTPIPPNSIESLDSPQSTPIPDEITSDKDKGFDQFL